MNDFAPAAGDEPDTDVDMRITLLDSPFGDAPHLLERDRAAEWLVQHADRAYPALLARLAAGSAGPGAAALLPRFGRAESIPVLARLLAGPELVAWEAGQALALHPQTSAGAALRQALADPDPAVATIAADALGARGDPCDCAPLVQRLDTAHAGLRYHLLQAAGHLGGVPPAVLDELARSDPDAEIRALARHLK
jgi:HEAT repeat protein